jgi:alkylated DNA repair dioxygenase AlkB
VLEEDGEVVLWRGFVPLAEASKLTQELVSTLAWHSETISMFGRQIEVPRLVCWYGDPGAVYRYSGVAHQPLPWLPVLSALRERVEQATGETFNSVLANLYRNGQDSMGWHADNEPELGPQPQIASLNFGATRRFRLQHRKTKRVVSVALASGDLLFMAGDTQKYWRHSVPKERDVDAPRVNLTFRRIVRAPSSRNNPLPQHR